MTYLKLLSESSQTLSSMGRDAAGELPCRLLPAHGKEACPAMCAGRSRHADDARPQGQRVDRQRSHGDQDGETGRCQAALGG